MKVIQTISGLGLNSSGSAFAVPGFCRGLRSLGVDVELHARTKGCSRDYSFPVCGYPYHRSILPGGCPELLHGLRDACASADILHANGLWNMCSVYPGWVKKQFPKMKLVLSPHGVFAPWALRKGWLKKKLFWWCFQRQVVHLTDMFHATSEKEYGEIRDLGFRQPVVIAPLGLDFPRTYEYPEIRTNGRWGTPGKRKIVFFGRLHVVKSIDTLLRAWKRISLLQKEWLEDWEVLIAGPDCGMKEDLLRLVKRESIPRVEFVGELLGIDKYDFLASSDICVLPSLTENYGVTIAEALICDTPVVASRGTPWSILETIKAGRWIERDTGLWSSALLDLMALSDSERRRMGRNGREWIISNCSWESIGRKLKMAYAWLLGDAEKPEFVQVD